MGPIADVLVIATSAYNFIQGGMSEYQQGMTEAALGLGVLGAVAGILLLLGSSGVAGPRSLFLIVAGIGLMVADKCKTDGEERALREKRAKIEDWCRHPIALDAVGAHA